MEHTHGVGAHHEPRCNRADPGNWGGFIIRDSIRPGLRIPSDSNHFEPGKNGPPSFHGSTDFVNYKEHPNWQQEVLRLTNGLGVDHVIEVGGTGTLPKSIEAVRPSGLVSLIGLLTGVSDPINIAPILFKAVRLRGIVAGSIEMSEAMTRTIAARKLKPVIAKVFRFEKAKDALAKLQDAQHVGKIVIRID